jgi:hypothetical protein
MTYDFAALDAIAREVERRRGATDEVLARLRDAGASPVASMKVLCDLRGIGVGEAKQIVWGSPVWADLRPAQEQLEADILDALQTDGIEWHWRTLGDGVVLYRLIHKPQNDAHGSQRMIQIWRSDDRYQVAVSPPDGPYWRSSDPMTATEVLAKLSQLGCHSTDITDALYAADPGWGLEHDRSVLRERHRTE